MLDHGGGVRQAAERFGIAREDWIDLSTGLAPYEWPLPALAVEDWARLPEEQDGLEALAQSYYQASHALPVAGSQAAIQALPRLFSDQLRVGIVEPCYAEHRQAWEQAGHQVLALALPEVAEQLPDLDLLVVVNPNNPTGQVIDVETLLMWHQRLHQHGGCLLVDEAFADPRPQLSLAPYSDRPGLLVLRSLGKFFGLAGVRLGFVLAEPVVLSSLRRLLGPWSVSGPARAIGKAALANRMIQCLWRTRLQQDSARLVALLARAGLSPAGGCELFQYLPMAEAEGLYLHMAERGILLRLFDAPPAVRIGLPGTEAGWQQLQRALEDYIAAPLRRAR